MHGMEKDMPPIVHEIASIIGEPAALKVIAHYGGRNLNLVGQVRQDIARLIGSDSARMLIAHFRGVEVSIPLCTVHVRNMRNAALLVRFDTLSKTQSARRAVVVLAAEFHITERHVWRLLKSS